MTNKPRPENNDGQYIVDRLDLIGKPDPDSDWHEIEQFDGGTPVDLHFSTLYDEPEDQSGELVDLATGEKYHNDSTAGEGIGVISAREAAKISKVEPEVDEVVDRNLLTKAQREKLMYKELMEKPADRLTSADIEFITKYLERQKALAASRRRHPSRGDAQIH